MESIGFWLADVFAAATFVLLIPALVLILLRIKKSWRERTWPFVVALALTAYMVRFQLSNVEYSESDEYGIIVGFAIALLVMTFLLCRKVISKRKVENSASERSSNHDAPGSRSTSREKIGSAINGKYSSALKLRRILRLKMHKNVQIALIVSLAAIISVFLIQYFSPYNHCYKRVLDEFIAENEQNPFLDSVPQKERNAELAEFKSLAALQCADAINGK